MPRDPSQPPPRWYVACLTTLDRPDDLAVQLRRGRVELVVPPGVLARLALADARALAAALNEACRLAEAPAQSAEVAAGLEVLRQQEQADHLRYHSV